MNPKALLTISVLAIVLASCNDKTSEYQAPTAQSEAPASPAVDANAPANAALLSEFKGDLSSLGKADLCALDAVNGKSPIEGSFEVPTNTPMAFEGWAATTSLTNPGTVAVVLSATDKAFAISGNAGIARDDVAKAYKAEALSNSGFKLELPSLQVPPGEYTVAILHDEAGVQVSCASPLKLVIH